MAARGRRPMDSKAGFRNPAKESKDATAVIQTILKQARQSGQLNLSNRSLTEVPPMVWRINIDVPEEARNISLDNAEDRWWEQVDLTKLILASNSLVSISEDIHQLPALTVLDIHDNRLSSLPKALASLRHLQKLVLSHNSLTSLPDFIGDLESLQFLHLDHNSLLELNPNVAKLNMLEELDVSHNKLTSLPENIGFLNSLFRLNFKNNKISVIPHGIGSMSSLRMLDGASNQIHSVPDELGDLSRLEQLYLRYNKITHLPTLTRCTSLKELHLGFNAIAGITAEHLETMPAISMLDLGENKIRNLPEEITLLQNLERLDLSNNDLSTLPYCMGGMHKLKAIVLDGNPMKGIRRDIIMRGTIELKKYLQSRIAEEPSTAPAAAVRQTGGTSGIVGGGHGEVDAHEVKASKTLDYSAKKAASIPDDIFDLAVKSELRVVNFSKNALTVWPERLSELGACLQELNLGFNKLSVVPHGVTYLTSLLYLDLRNNQLSDLPDELANLPVLRELILSFNRFPKVPDVVYRCSKLEILLASDNQISSVDAEGLQQMSRLATLDLQNNSIQTVPPELGLCEQLRALQLEGNSFKVPRVAILSKGTNAVLEYLRSRIAT